MGWLLLARVVPYSLAGLCGRAQKRRKKRKGREVHCNSVPATMFPEARLSLFGRSGKTLLFRPEELPAGAVRPDGLLQAADRSNLGGGGV